MKAYRWNIGETKFSEPRLLHDFEEVVLLVGRVYRCQEMHDVLSYSPSMLNSLPKHLITFKLYYRIGFITTFLDTCITMAEHGTDFSTIVEIINTRRVQKACQSEAQYWTCLQQHENSDISIHVNGFQSDLYTKIPSRKMLTAAYLEEFFLIKEEYYNNFMRSLLCEGTIAIDHTFHVAANIGYFRSDRRWVSQYEAVFIVLNEKGQVLTWQFTKNKGFQEVKRLLENLKKRP
jgi:hypothetical protein